MEKEFDKIQELPINSSRSIVLKNYLENPYIWTYVYARENGEETYIGFYGNIKNKKNDEYIKYNEDYVAFCFLNPYVRNAEFIKNIYDMNTKEFLGYNEYPEFKEKHGEALKLKK